MKKKLFPIDIDELKAISSKNHFHEKRPIRCTVIVIAFLFLLVALAVCFFREDLFTVNQMTFLGVFGASVISLFTILLSLNQEQRSAYHTARRSALLLSNILDSLYSQIERISNGSVHPIAYPLDWIHYYEQCCTYLQYDYLPYLLREFDIVEKLNQCILSNDKTGMERLLKYRKDSITDWTLDFSIISTKTNLSLFAFGSKELVPWNQGSQYKKFKNFVIETYGCKIKDLTTEYLSKNGGHCDSRDAEYFTMNQLRKETELQNDPYWHFAVDNRAMLNVIFGVYMSLKPDDGFSLCWGELSLRKKDE